MPAAATKATPRPARSNAAAARSARPEVRTKLSVSKVDDQVEREADAVAARVISRSSAPTAPSESRGAARSPDVHREGEAAPSGGAPAVPAALEAYITSASGGEPLPSAVRERIEPHLGADLTGVRVHADAAAADAAAQLQARAFTYGKDIFLGAGESAGDIELMAHESTHVVQQGAVEVFRKQPDVMRDEEPSSDDSWLPDYILEGMRDAAAAVIPGYTLLTQVIGKDPITSQAVKAPETSFVEDILTFAPGLFGPAVAPLLSVIDVIGDVFALVRDGLVAHDLTLTRVLHEAAAAWDEMSITEGIDGNVAILERHVGAVIDDIRAFVRDIANTVIEAVRRVVAKVAEPLLESDAIKPLWDLAKKVLHKNPLTGDAVSAPTVEILGDFLVLIGQGQVKDQMNERGTLQETADWLDTQFGTFDGLLTELSSIFSAAWEAIQPQNLVNLMENLNALADRVFGLILRVKDFAATVIVTVLDLVKKSLLGWLSNKAHELPGFHLITVILERNPFTEEPVPRTPENLIRGFLSLLPGGEQMYDKLAESGVIADAAARVEGAMTALGISWEMVTGLFLGIWDAITLERLLDPIGTFSEILDRFGDVLGRLVSFVGTVVRELVTLVLTLMNFPSELMSHIITNAAQAIDDIEADPIAFLMNMLEAVKAGFMGFLGNIDTYLLQGLGDWLLRGLGAMGVKVPTDLSFQSVLDTVLQVLGVGVDTLWKKLADKIGPEKADLLRKGMDVLTGAWAFIKDVTERGVVAIWQYVESQLSNLWDMVLGAAKDWVVSQIISKVTSKLLSMLDPTGIMAVVNSFIAFFSAVQSAMEYLREILQIVDTYVGTLAAVAAGNIAPGAAMLEGGLAAAIPVALGFLANQVGLGNVPEKVIEIIKGLRHVIDEALDWLFDQAMRLGQAALAAVGVGAGEAEPAPELTPYTLDEEVTRTDGGHHLKTHPDSTDLFVHSTPVPLTAITPMTPELAGLITTYGTARTRYDVALASQNQQRLSTTGSSTPITTAQLNESRKLREQLSAVVKLVVEYMRKQDGPRPDSPGASAPNIGMTARHHQQARRVTRKLNANAFTLPHDKTKSGSRVWQTQSEHVLPFAVGETLWRLVGEAPLVRRKSGRFLDGAQMTIVLYMTASNEKTSAEDAIISKLQSDAEANLAAVWSAIEKAEDRETFDEQGAEAARGNIYDALMGPIEMALAASVTETNDQISAESKLTEEGYSGPMSTRRAPFEGPPEPVIPGPTEVEAAAQQQKLDIITLLATALVVGDSRRAT